MTIFNVISLAGGLALFLYGMSIMGTGLEKYAGGRMESILQKLTSSTWRAVALGAVITALIQSSSGTTVIVVGLVNSGIMQLSQAIGIIMGANIGTTVTGQIIRLSDISGGGMLMEFLKPATFAPILAFVGAVLFVFIKSPRKRDIGQIFMGFGLLFIGMGMMTDSVSTLRESELFVRLFTTLQNPILGVLAGTLVTVAVQSSSASVGILQALSSTGLVTWGSAIPIILGQNIGTTSTSLIASIGTSKAAKRSAMVHVYFNIIGTVIFMAAIYGVKAAVGFSWWNDTMNMGDIANFHTLFNVVVTLLFLPFTKLLAKLAEMTIPDKPGEKQDIEIPVLDERLFKSPAVALQQAKNAVVKMSRRAARNVGLATPLLLKMDEDVVSAIDVRENLIDRMEVDISNYLIKLADQELGDAESHEVTELLNFVTECERIGDYAVNIKEKAQELTDKEVTFSEKAQQELKLLDNALEKILTLTTDAFEFDDARTASQVEPLEQVIDILVERLRAQHIKRLKEGACSIDTGVVYLDVLNNVERISDHCSNIAARLVGMEAGEDYDSHTLKNMMHHNPTKEYMLNYEQCRKDYLVPLEQLEA